MATASTSRWRTTESINGESMSDLYNAAAEISDLYYAEEVYKSMALLALDIRLN